MGPKSGWLADLPAHRLIAEMSLWSANLVDLSGEIARVEDMTDIFHIDVADGHFSPAMLYFPDLVASVRKQTRGPLHVHLMVADSILESQIEQFAEAGADLVSIHAESQKLADGLALVAKLGLPAGLVLQLHTPVTAAAPWLGRISFLTLLGTRIGVKGQGLDPQAEPRLGQAHAMPADREASRRTVLAADGGIREDTAPTLRRAGAETIVMGSLAFNAPDPQARMRWVREL
jgi:ribulose-phosphate 3-epimerase